MAFMIGDHADGMHALMKFLELQLVMGMGIFG